MQSEGDFGAFRLDRRNECVWRGDAEVALTPKAFAVLDHLWSHAGQLVTKKSLLDTVWGDTVVGDAVIKVCVREIRKALDDDPKEPRFIQTVHRRGYRFIGATRGAAVDVAPAPLQSGPLRPATFVARKSALARLDTALDRASAGERQVLLVTGEAGIGKSSLVDVFGRSAAARPNVRVASGQCIEHYGEGEAYLPVLEAISRLVRESRADETLSLLTRYAPTWALQLPAIAERLNGDRLRLEAMGATRERMLREIAEAFEVFLPGETLVLLLEDLHWSDYSTLDLVSLLARRLGPARLMIVTTHRPSDVVLRSHPLRDVARELLGRPGCGELALGSLGEADVECYLRARFGAEDVGALAHAICERTGGNPLFMVHVVDHLVEQDLVDAEGRLTVDPSELNVGVPDTVRQIVERRITELDAADRELLSAASTAGREFDVTAVADAIGMEPVEAERRCDRMARRHELVRPSEAVPWPDGTISARYTFEHTLIQHVLLDLLNPADRVRVHRSLGERLEAGYGENAHQIAAVLSVHFEEGRLEDKAVAYRLAAARGARLRHANREALKHLAAATQVASRLWGKDRDRAVMDVLTDRGLVLRAMGDMQGAAQEFEAVAETARAQQLPAREAQAELYLASALFWVARDLCLRAVDRAAAAAERLDDDELRAHVRGWCGHWNLSLRGWSAPAVRACEEAVISARAAEQPEWLRLHLVRSIFLEMLRGDYEAADRAALEATRLTLAQGDAFDHLLAHFFHAWALLHAGRWREMRTVLERGENIARKNGHDLWLALFGLNRAQLAEQACAFERARALAGPALARAATNPSEAGQLLFHAQIVCGLAELGLGRHADAAHQLIGVSEAIATTPFDVDWMLHLPLRWAELSLALQSDAAEPIANAAERLHDLARCSGERTYRALAFLGTARAADMAGDCAAAEAARAEALALVDDEKRPLAAWRVHRAAAAAAKGAAATAHRKRAVAVLARLRGELEGEQELAATLAAVTAKVSP